MGSGSWLQRCLVVHRESSSETKILKYPHWTKSCAQSVIMAALRDYPDQAVHDFVHHQISPVWLAYCTHHFLQHKEERKSIWIQYTPDTKIVDTGARKDAAILDIFFSPNLPFAGVRRRAKSMGDPEVAEGTATMMRPKELHQWQFKRRNGT